MLIIFIVFAAGFLIFLRKEYKKGQRELAATYYHCDMGDKFHELLDDPFMSDAKWREWIPIFEDADRRFAETHPDIKNFFRIAEAARKEIDDPRMLLPS